MNLRIRSGAVGSIVAALVSAAILLVATTLAGLTGAAAEVAPPDPTSSTTASTTSEPTATASPTPSDTATPTADPTPTTDPTPTVDPTPTTDPVVAPGWATKSFTMADGRTYFARVPVCAPATSATCAPYLTTPRQLVLIAHGYGGGETLDVATSTLDVWASLRKPADTLFVYLVSKDGTRAFNGGICCTFNDVDDVTYAANVVADLAQHVAVNTARVGILGNSNGGMLALRVACERPDVFDAGSSWAGTFAGPCPKAGVRISQLHGGADKYIPVRGGTTYIAGHWIAVPPAVDLAATMAPGNAFPLTVVAGVGHNATFPVVIAQLGWLLANLRS